MYTAAGEANDKQKIKYVRGLYGMLESNSFMENRPAEKKRKQGAQRDRHSVNGGQVGSLGR